MAATALAWVLAKDAVTSPIVGISSPERLKDAISALEISLTAEEFAAMEAPYLPQLSPELG
jgi:aryl-alcohol dehydrogenase-like predicted oxidoreductase